MYIDIIKLIGKRTVYNDKKKEYSTRMKEWI